MQRKSEILRHASFKKGRRACLYGVMLFSLAGLGCIHSGREEPVKIISGVLRRDTTLSGRIKVKDDLLVPAGVTLTLLPGTELLFLPAENSRIEPRFLSPQTELLVRGTIKAEGTAEQPIRFISPTEKTSAWAGIILDRSSGDAIRHAIVEYPWAGIWVVDASPKIANVHINHAVYGILVHKKSLGTEVENCRIENSRFGIFLGPGAQIARQNNRFEKIEKDPVFSALAR